MFGSLSAERIFDGSHHLFIEDGPFVLRIFSPDERDLRPSTCASNWSYLPRQNRSR